MYIFHGTGTRCFLTDSARPRVAVVLPANHRVWVALRHENGREKKKKKKRNGRTGDDR